MKNLKISTDLVLANAVAVCVFCVTMATDNQIVYMDKYGYCQSDEYIYVNEESVTVKAKGSQEVYQAMKCTVMFKTDVDEQLCVKFTRYSITDCSVSLVIYNKNSASGSYLKKFGCDDVSATVCSDTRYLTLLLKKERIDSQMYDFQLEVLQEKMNNLQLQQQRSGEIIVSLSLIIGLILGVVFAITVLAVIIVCCCCKKDKHHGKVHKRKPDGGRGNHQAGLLDHPGPEPSAPPLQSDMEIPMSLQYHQGPSGAAYTHSYPMEPPPPYEQPSAVPPTSV